MNIRTIANGLGWFSIALGLTEVLAAKGVAKTLGINSPTLVRAFGVREIAAGIAILTQDRKGIGVWARIAGDALDGAVLGWALRKDNPQRGKAALAMAAVAPVIALDILCGKELGLR